METAIVVHDAARARFGEEHPNAKHAEAVVAEARARRDAARPQKAFAANSAHSKVAGQALAARRNEFKQAQEDVLARAAELAVAMGKLDQARMRVTEKSKVVADAEAAMAQSKSCAVAHSAALLLAQLADMVHSMHKPADDDAHGLAPETQLALAGLLPTQDQMRPCQ